MHEAYPSPPRKEGQRRRRSVTPRESGVGADRVPASSAIPAPRKGHGSEIRISDSISNHQRIRRDRNDDNGGGRRGGGGPARARAQASGYDDHALMDSERQSNKRFRSKIVRVDYAKQQVLAELPIELKDRFKVRFVTIDMRDIMDDENGSKPAVRIGQMISLRVYNRGNDESDRLIGKRVRIIGMTYTVNHDETENDDDSLKYHPFCNHGLWQFWSPFPRSETQVNPSQMDPQFISELAQNNIFDVHKLDLKNGYYFDLKPDLSETMDAFVNGAHNNHHHHCHRQSSKLELTLDNKDSLIVQRYPFPLSMAMMDNDDPFMTRMIQGFFDDDSKNDYSFDPSDIHRQLQLWHSTMNRNFALAFYHAQSPKMNRRTHLVPLPMRRVYVSSSKKRISYWAADLTHRKDGPNLMYFSQSMFVQRVMVDSVIHEMIATTSTGDEKVLCLDGIRLEILHNDQDEVMLRDEPEESLMSKRGEIDTLRTLRLKRRLIGPRHNIDCLDQFLFRTLGFIKAGCRLGFTERSVRAMRETFLPPVYSEVKKSPSLSLASSLSSSKKARKKQMKVKEKSDSMKQRKQKRRIVEKKGRMSKVSSSSSSSNRHRSLDDSHHHHSRHHPSSLNSDASDDDDHDLEFESSSSSRSIISEDERMIMNDNRRSDTSEKGSMKKRRKHDGYYYGRTPDGRRGRSDPSKRKKSGMIQRDENNRKKKEKSGRDKRRRIVIKEAANGKQQQSRRQRRRRERKGKRKRHSRYAEERSDDDDTSDISDDEKSESSLSSFISHESGSSDPSSFSESESESKSSSDSSLDSDFDRLFKDDNIKYPRWLYFNMVNWQWQWLNEQCCLHIDDLQLIVDDPFPARFTARSEYDNEHIPFDLFGQKPHCDPFNSIQQVWSFIRVKPKSGFIVIKPLMSRVGRRGDPGPLYEDAIDFWPMFRIEDESDALAFYESGSLQFDIDAWIRKFGRMLRKMKDKLSAKEQRDERNGDGSEEIKDDSRDRDYQRRKKKSKRSERRGRVKKGRSKGRSIEKKRRRKRKTKKSEDWMGSEDEKKSDSEEDESDEPSYNHRRRSSKMKKRKPVRMSDESLVEDDEQEDEEEDPHDPGDPAFYPDSSTSESDSESSVKRLVDLEPIPEE